MTRWLDADPWTVPVPVAPSRYLSLDPAHQPWNVETAPGRVAPFSWDLDALDPEALTSRVVRELAATLGATRRERALLAALGHAMAGGVFARRPVDFTPWVGAALEGAQPAQPTVTGRAEFLAAKGLGAPALTERARWFRDAVESVEALGDRDAALEAARRALADGG